MSLHLTLLCSNLPLCQKYIPDLVVKNEDSSLLVLYPKFYVFEAMFFLWCNPSKKSRRGVPLSATLECDLFFPSRGKKEKHVLWINLHVAFFYRVNQISLGEVMHRPHLIICLNSPRPSLYSQFTDRNWSRSSTHSQFYISSLYIYQWVVSRRRTDVVIACLLTIVCR